MVPLSHLADETISKWENNSKPKLHSNDIFIVFYPPTPFNRKSKMSNVMFSEVMVFRYKITGKNRTLNLKKLLKRKRRKTHYRPLRGSPSSVSTFCVPTVPNFRFLPSLSPRAWFPFSPRGTELLLVLFCWRGLCSGWMRWPGFPLYQVNNSLTIWTYSFCE